MLMKCRTRTHLFYRTKGKEYRRRWVLERQRIVHTAALVSISVIDVDGVETYDDDKNDCVEFEIDVSSDWYDKNEQDQAPR